MMPKTFGPGRPQLLRKSTSVIRKTPATTCGGENNELPNFPVYLAGEQSMRTRTIVIGIILGCGGLFVVAIVACAGHFFLGFRNTDAAFSPKIDALFAAIDNGTFKDMYATETTPELKKAATREEWEQLGLLIKTPWPPQGQDAHAVRRSTVECRHVCRCYVLRDIERETREISTARLRSVDGEWRLVVFRVKFSRVPHGLVHHSVSHCGEPCPKSAKFCPKCGKFLEHRTRRQPLVQNDGPRRTGAAGKVAPPTAKRPAAR